MLESITYALIGGAIIGVAASMMLIFNGRVTGISGIFNGILSFPKGDLAWRVAFIAGLVFGGAALYSIRPDMFINESGRPLWLVAVAGLIVGFGTVMGSGCTSGHGVCGISRFSPRSIVATIAFMGAGIVTATLLRTFFGL